MRYKDRPLPSLPGKERSYSVHSTNSSHNSDIPLSSEPSSPLIEVGAHITLILNTSTGQREPHLQSSFLHPSLPPPCYDINTLATFSFADLSYHQSPRCSYPSEFYFFVLTDAQAKQRYVYCRRFLMHSTAVVPEVFCVVSVLPLVSFFAEWMRIVEQRQLAQKDGWEWLKRLIATCQVPKTREMRLETPTPVMRYWLPIPSPRETSAQMFVEMLRQVSSSYLPRLLQSIQLEYHVILLSKHLYRLGVWSMSLLSPWMMGTVILPHVCIPFIPNQKKWTGLVECPVPLLVGMTRDTYETLSSQQLENVIVFDVDQRGACCHAGKALPSWSEACTMTFTLQIKQAKSLQDTEQVALAVQRACADLFAGWIKGLRPFVSDQGLEVDAFIASRSLEEQEWIAAFVETQAFHTYLDAFMVQIGKSEDPGNDSGNMLNGVAAEWRVRAESLAGASVWGHFMWPGNEKQRPIPVLSKWKRIMGRMTR